ncbi:NADH-cytochrome b5 reductase-like [Drosophila grimshawi]|uniref:GH24852 n=1 Tax=Drosophila grimshawi TaxID=7222 RepID=B4JNN5_DROGR|nr:NADH-cytochrome b5 reductase-like [Drosophila grimshawi]EDV92328.1 GH24852 [Drosophila grimshawi]
MHMPDEVDESDCCGNGCTNCILDNRPAPSQRALLAGKRNVIENYARFRLLSNEAMNGDAQVRILHFGHTLTEDADDDDDSILDIPPGHHIMLRAELAGHAVLRPYSPYWTDFVGKQFKIVVKLRAGGPMSDYLATLQPMQVLQFRGPIGNYAHDASRAKCIFIIAQGVAIAPTLPLVAEVLDNEDDMCCIRHLICAQDLQHVYFRDRLLDFAQYWNYNHCLYLAHQRCAFCADGCDESCEQLRKSLRYRETVHTGRLDANRLASHRPVSSSNAAAAAPIVIISGHSSFQQAMRETAASVLAVPDEHIFLL